MQMNDSGIAITTPASIVKDGMSSMLKNSNNKLLCDQSEIGLALRTIRRIPRNLLSSSVATAHRQTIAQED